MKLSKLRFSLYMKRMTNGQEQGSCPLCSQRPSPLACFLTQDQMLMVHVEQVQRRCGEFGHGSIARLCQNKCVEDEV